LADIRAAVDGARNRLRRWTKKSGSQLAPWDAATFYGGHRRRNKVE
jgi:hypothetical protein